jgi:hypothetical protein
VRLQVPKQAVARAQAPAAQEKAAPPPLPKQVQDTARPKRPQPPTVPMQDPKQPTPPAPMPKQHA